jgi:Flp pilus assembly protein TadD
MSIITDSLNRLQAERARRPGQPRVSATPESAEAADFRDPVFSPPHSPARALRNRLSLVVLGSVGIAAYLWGLPLIAAPDKVPPAQETVKELNPVQHVPSQIVEAIPERREEPFTATMAKASEDSKPTEAASATVTDPSAKTTVAKDTPARSTRSSPGVRSTAKPPPALNVDSASSNQRKNRVSSFLRNATPLQVKLARAQYFIKKRRYARAVTVLQPLFVEPPEHWEPWFWLGTAQLGLSQWEKARASLVEGLARDATVPQLWVQRALVSQQQGRFGEALDALRQAELLAPDLPEVQLNLAYSLDVEGNRLVAVKHYRMFLTLTEGQKAYHATRKKVLDRLSHLSKT